MTLTIQKTELEEILCLRTLYLQENNFQIRYHACHERGWSDSYLIEFDGLKIGYAAIKGAKNLDERDAVFELYLIPSFRHLSSSA